MSDLYDIVPGDCLEFLRTLPDACVDSVVTDPPYELAFMGKGWDSAGVSFDPATWREILRVLRPGGYLIAFGGTRTAHRITCAIEDAGFWILDTLPWIYGSGFPKSVDISKVIDKRLGAERTVIGPNPCSRSSEAEAATKGRSQSGATVHASLTAPVTPEAQRWVGWGSALKPAHEPIVLAQRPFKKTFADQALEHGNGALNIDGCRVGADGEELGRSSGGWDRGRASGLVLDDGTGRDFDYDSVGKVPAGRFPPNVLLTHSAGCEFVGEEEEDRALHEATGRTGMIFGAGLEGSRVIGTQRVYRRVYRCAPGCPVAELDRQSGASKSRKGKPRKSAGPGEGYGMVHTGAEYDDRGGASRFFPDFEWDPALDVAPFLYCAKASTAEREAGCEALPVKSGGELTDREDGSAGLNSPRAGAGRRGGRRNGHPCIKPVALMRWLVRLVTPPNGIVLDPFAGSGTTGVAAILEGFPFVGIELTPEYVPILEARLEHAVKLRLRALAKVLK